MVDFSGCAPAPLRDRSELSRLFDRLVETLDLEVVQPSQWHVFGGPGGVTGLALLAESHLAVHTFPETGFAALNVYCCRERRTPDFEALGRELLGATSTSVRCLKRGAGE